MGLSLLCKDLDPASSCPYVARGETMDELNADLTRHAKAVHSYTDAQLTDPKMVEAIKAAVKQD
jgi:predicted small metal-binding protein